MNDFVDQDYVSIGTAVSSLGRRISGSTAKLMRSAPSVSRPMSKRGRGMISAAAAAPVNGHSDRLGGSIIFVCRNLWTPDHPQERVPWLPDGGPLRAPSATASIKDRPTPEPLLGRSTDDNNTQATGPLNINSQQVVLRCLAQHHGQPAFL
jgi:hypothetical protein